MGFAAGTPLRDGLTRGGYDGLTSMTLMSVNEVDDLEWDDAGTITHVPAGARALLLQMLSYLHFGGMNMQNHGEMMGITGDDFMEYRHTILLTDVRGTLDSARGSGTTPAHAGAASVNHTAYPKFATMMKQRKLNAESYPVLSLQSKHAEWNQAMISTARAQGIECLLDKDYVPNTQDEQLVFPEIQKFLYDVLHKNVKYTAGKQIVKKHFDTYDAQKAYEELCAYHKNSVTADHEMQDISTFIHTAKVSKFRSCTKFIMFWKTQLEAYNDMIEKEIDKYSDMQAKKLLENAVMEIGALQNVQTTAKISGGKGSKSPITFDEYYELLHSAALVYDKSRSDRNSSRAAARKINYHHIEDEEDELIDQDIEFGIDIDDDDELQTILVNLNDMGRRPPSKPNQASFLPSSVYKKLPQTTRDQWSKLDPEFRASLLRVLKPKDGGGATQHGEQRRPVPRYQSNVHEIADEDDDRKVTFDDDDPTTTTADGSESETTAEDSLLINLLTKDAGNIKRLLSQSSGNRPTETKKSSKSTKGMQRRVNVTYIVTKARIKGSKDAIIDRGANGLFLNSSDCRVISKPITKDTCTVQGAGNHELTDIPIRNVGSVIETTSAGPIIGIWNNAAISQDGKTCLSSLQMEANGVDVDEKSRKNGGNQSIKVDGITIPLRFKDGLPRLKLRPYSDHEFKTLRHVMMTADSPWDPTIFDDVEFDPDEWFDSIEDHDELDGHFDEVGNYRDRVVMSSNQRYLLSSDESDLTSAADRVIALAETRSSKLRSKEEAKPEEDVYYFDSSDKELSDEDVSELDPGESEEEIFKGGPIFVDKKNPDYEAIRPLLGWISTENVKKTFDNTTQYGRLPQSTVLQKTWNTSNPALNIERRNEDVACDIVYSDTPAVDNGAKAAVIFFGTSSHVTDIEEIKTDKEFVNALEDNIRKRGAMKRLLSDRAQVEISVRAMNLLRGLAIGQWQSEPHQQQQNPSERKYQTSKNWTNRVLNRSGAPPEFWLLALQYVVYLMNHTFNMTIMAIPLQILLGTTVDISALLRFYFYQKVYFRKYEDDYPGKDEIMGYWVGISEHVGHHMTYKIYNPDTKRILHRSVVRPVDPHDRNIRADLLAGEQEFEDRMHEYLKSKSDDNFKNGAENDSSQFIIPTVTTVDDLIGRTFLMKEKPDGTAERAKIIKAIRDSDAILEGNSERIKFLCKLSESEKDELLTYQEVMDYLSKDEESPTIWKFKRIAGHEGPLDQHHPNYKGSSYNVMIEWENGEKSYEPLDVFGHDDPITCAMYATENNLLDKPGWKRFKRWAKKEKQMKRMINQSRQRNHRSGPKYMFGFQVPRDHAEAMLIDKRNGNTKWRDSDDKELVCMKDFGVFQDLGPARGQKIPDGYTLIRAHFVRAVKHDGRHRSRIVAGGHLTEDPTESAYAGVVSLRGLRMVLFLAELNGYVPYAADVSSAYLTAKTNEKVCIIAGPEFKELEGHLLVVKKALYGLKTSGIRYHERWAEVMISMGFFPCRAEPDIWMRRAHDDSSYEYIATYTDDICLAVKDPKPLLEKITKEHDLHFKGEGEISYHLGMNIERDEFNVLCIEPRKYIAKLKDSYQQMFGEKPRQIYHSPLEKGDHPEMDTSEFLDIEGIAIYQSMIGALQWCVSIGRFDITVAVMSMSGFRSMPRQGHLERLKRIYGYICKFPHAKLRIRTKEPDYSDIPDLEVDWDKSIYGKLKEEIPADAPEPLGKYVTTTSHVDANLLHDLLTGRSVTAILHFLNQFPIDWYSKKQRTVETATYGSEMQAAKICVEQIIDLRLTLRYLGVPIREKSYMFGDNEAVVKSTTRLHTKLNKRSSLLSFHRVREAIASGVIVFTHLSGEQNAADILSKHWGYHQVWENLLRPLMFVGGETLERK